MPVPGYGERINDLRRAKRLTQADLCRLCGFSPISVSHWENEKTAPQIESWRVLARVLESSVEWLRDARTEYAKIAKDADLSLIETDDLIREILRRGFVLAGPEKRF